MDASTAAPTEQGAHALPIRVGTRGSPLALAQARAVLDRLPAPAETVLIRTSGDASQSSGQPLAALGGKGLWAREIHEALLAGRIDCAVHSLKDLETTLPPGIVLAAVLPREDCRDALILGERRGMGDGPFDALPPRAHVGTASVRRAAQLLHARPDLSIGPLRGNVETRLAKVADGECDATLLALAGLNRLGLAGHASIVLEPEAMLPAACQGIIGVTARLGDAVLASLSAIEDAAARVVAEAERALLAALDGSCRTPIGAHATLLPAGELQLVGLVARPDGSFLLRRTLAGPAAEAARIGAELGRDLRRDSPAGLFA
jgi:hydroxymethylbilane synthase